MRGAAERVHGVEAGEERAQESLITVYNYLKGDETKWSPK